VPRVFISYSHDSDLHSARVRALADQLRTDGIESWLDQYAQDPDEGWIVWMRRQVKRSDKVLLVFTETYQRRFQGDESKGEGLGATFEGAIVTEALYESGGRNAKFRPVVFRDEDEQFIPLELRRFNRYRVDTPENYRALLRWLHEAPPIVSPLVGQKPDLPPEPAPELFSSKREREEQERLEAERREKKRVEAEARQRKEEERLEAERREVPAPVSDASQAIDRVNFSVFAPGVIRPAQQFLLDLWVHLPTQSDEVTSMIREFARDRRLGVKPRVAVVRGAALSVVLDLPSLRIKDPSNTIFWNGEPDYASFVVEVPADIAVGDHPGRVIITASGIPISKVTFCLPIEEEGARVEKTPRELPTGRHQPHSAFASFSGRDRKDVLGRVQGMTKVCQDLDVFVDVLSLRSGQDWESQIRQQIPARDVFFLFWSFHASRSKEVEKEWRIALEMRGLDFIDPIPLNDPRVSPPPKELASLHFNDLYIAQIQMEESLKKLRKRCWWEFWRP
jgi:hypothetical protein